MGEPELKITAKAQWPQGGVPIVVEVTDPTRPWLKVSMTVYHSDTSISVRGDDEDPESSFFRLGEVRVSVDNLHGAQPTQVLADSTWWRGLLTRVLEHLAFNSSDSDHAYERGVKLLYGWEDGEVEEAEFESAEDAEKDGESAMAGPPDLETFHRQLEVFLRAAFEGEAGGQASGGPDGPKAGTEGEESR